MPFSICQCCLVFLVAGQGPTDLRPAVGPLTPAEAEKAMVAAPGLAVTLIASEPGLVDPVCAAFDEKGRLFVAEMRGYPNGGVGTGEVSSGRIRLLTDENRDGKFDKSLIYAEGLRFPMGLLPWRGGLLVAQAPEILFLKDADCDGRAEIRQTLYSGFLLPNIQQLVNTLTLGLDGRVHAMVGGAGGDIRCPGVPAFKLSLRGRACSFDPDTPGSMRAETGGGQYGLAADRLGRWFTNTNSQHLRFIALTDSLLAGNPHLAPPSPTVDIPEHGAACKVFRLSEPEPWRVERTRRRVGSPEARRLPSTELVPAGYSTSACSPLPLDGGLFTGIWRDAVLVCDPANNLIIADKLIPQGAGFTATRLLPETEALASRDNFFRPVHLSFMPDGAVMVCDFYREAIETPLSLPDDLKARMGLESKEKGRLWRLAPIGKPPQALEALPLEWAQRLPWLGDDNPWRRFTAHRLVLEEHSPAVVDSLRAMAANEPRSLARVHALSLLARLAKLDNASLTACLAHGDAGVREVALTCLMSHRESSASTRSAASRLLDDTAPRVRFQAAAWAAREGLFDALLAKCLWRDADEPWIVAAAWSSLSPDLARYVKVWGDEAGKTPLGSSHSRLLSQAGRQIGARPSSDAIPLLARSLKLTALQDPAWRGAFLDGLSLGMRQAGHDIESWWAPVPVSQGKSSPAPLAVLEPLLRAAAATLVDGKAKESDRQSAASLLALAPSSAWRGLASEVLHGKNSPALQLTTITALAGRRDTILLSEISAGLPAMAQAARAELISQLISTPVGQHSLLTAVELGKAPPALIDAAARTVLLSSRQPALKTRAEKIFTAINGSRQEVFARYQPVATKGPGDAIRGREVFGRHCITCHKVGETGHTVGPELKAALQGKDKDALLLAILDPSREIDPRFAQMVMETGDGRTIAGLLAAETPVSVTLRRAEGIEETVLRANLESLTATGKSLMPEGLEAQITPAQMGDLLEYLLQFGKGG